MGPVVPVNGRAAPLKREVYSCFICSFIFYIYFTLTFNESTAACTLPYCPEVEHSKRHS